MELARGFQHRATGLVRAMLVASATLAILLVCFSIYQYSQLDPEAAARLRTPRLPSMTTQTPGSARVGDDADTPGVALGQGVIGPGRKTQITLYPREGTRARLEIAVTDWTPVAGASNEFLLSEPEMRMLTKDGHPVRVTAKKGVLQAQRKTGGGLDPQRGKLTGDVVIEYDSLTEADRAKLPEEFRDKPDPSDIVRIELDEIEFDLEYSKLIVPGPFHLSAREVELQAADLEIRFNEAEDRVEFMRISQSGRLELRGQSEQLGLPIPAFDETGEQRLTLVEWLRASIQTRLDAQQEQARVDDAPAPAPPITISEEGVPIIRPDAKDEEEKTPKPPIRYFARFEGGIDATQRVGDVTRARLEADTLEIVREVSGSEKTRMRSAPPGIAQTDETKTLTNETILLEWTDRLLVEACSEEDERCQGDMRSKITAIGSPARISDPEGDATCTRLTFNPDGSKVWLEGTDADPVVVRYADQGTMSGLAVYSERRGGDMYVRVTGPGTLRRDPAANAPPVGSSEAEPDSRSTVEFTEQLEAHGRIVTTTRLDYIGRLVSRQQRVLDRASFVGRVKMRQDETNISADALTLTFGPQRSRSGGAQTVQRVAGQGHVVMEQGADRLSCREIDIALTTDGDGRTVPRTVTALGDVVADQGERTIEARDKLIVDFELVRRPPPSFDAVKAYAEVVKTGLDAARIDWEARRHEHEAGVRTEVGVRRLRAWGGVSIHDPAQGLDVTADEVDGTVANGRDIEKAFIKGSDSGPASVRLDTFTVSGREIKLDVPDQWAEVPGAGRLTFHSRRDLDGRKVDEPIPIAVTWNDWMKYQGRENRSVFSGGVHATSRTTTTFDCDQLIV
ncbi:MAG: hypothetical protein WBE26_03620, partial [Phycisphaerae bacterium]